MKRWESHKYKCEVSQRVPSLKAATKPSQRLLAWGVLVLARGGTQ